MERYAIPAASAGLLGLREQSVQAAGSNLGGFLHNATLHKMLGLPTKVTDDDSYADQD